MAFELYPSTLQDNFSKGSFSRVPGQNIVYSSMDTGPTKKRRRSTSRKDTIGGSIMLRDLTEYNTFDTWYRSTLQDGVKAFYFNDPVTQAQIVVSFKEGGMQYRDVGYNTYSVQMSLEVVNE
tara:strand:- start:7175 stop:7540 length:366 start_codon:yes stop_codon:yes gene_type:complete